MTQENDWQAIEVLVTTTETNTGTDIYAFVLCFKGKHGQDTAGPFRSSAPFRSLKRRYGSREVVPGSVCETLRNIRRQIDRLSESTRRRAEWLNSLPPGDDKGAGYYEHEREIIDALILISCHLRNVFHVFPRLAEKLVVPMFDYNESPTEDIRLKLLLDLFIHNRYMYLHNEYVTDLFSDEPPKGTAIAEKFMGYRFKVEDFLRVVLDAIHGVTVKDLATRLRSAMARLDVDTPHHKMVFLIQNVASFSDLLEALLPVKKDALMAMMLPERVSEEAMALAGGRPMRVGCRFTAPRVSMGRSCGARQQEGRRDDKRSDRVRGGRRGRAHGAGRPEEGGGVRRVLRPRHRGGRRRKSVADERPQGSIGRQGR